MFDATVCGRRGCLQRPMAPFIESFHQVIGLSISGHAEIDSDAESQPAEPVVKSFIPHPLILWMSSPSQVPADALSKPSKAPW